MNDLFKIKKGGSHMGKESMWSLYFFRGSFHWLSEYRDSDNIFAPRNIARVGFAVLDLSDSGHLNFNASEIGEADSVKYDAWMEI